MAGVALNCLSLQCLFPLYVCFRAMPQDSLPEQAAGMRIRRADEAGEVSPQLRVVQYGVCRERF